MDLETLQTALKAYYLAARGEAGSTVIETPVLLESLQMMQSSQSAGVSIFDDLPHTANELEEDDYSLIVFVEACTTSLLNNAEFPPEVTVKLRKVVICLIRVALTEDVVALSRPQPVLKILECLFEFAIGWRDLSAKSAQSSQAILDKTLLSLDLLTESLGNDESLGLARNHLLNLLREDLERVIAKETKRIGKLEKRLVDAEAGHLKIVRARNLAGELLNDKMLQQVLTEPVVKFLQGVWFESLQLILIRQGLQSNEWKTAVKLTETLIMTMQPQPGKSNTQNSEAAIELVESDDHLKESKKSLAALNAEELKKKAVLQSLYRIIENLPDELKDSLVSLQHDAGAADAALSIIESAHVEIMKGEELTAFEYTNIELSSGLFDPNTTVSKSLVSPVEKLQPGLWFVYTDDEKPARHIKLTLKMDEIKQLLFTNRNGAKILQVTFNEFAYLMGSEKAVVLPEPGLISNLIKEKLNKLLKWQQKKNKVEHEKIRRKARESLPAEESEFVLVAVRKDKLTGDELSAEEYEIVAGLNMGTTIKLRLEEQDVIEARLLVDDPVNEKVTFVDPMGQVLGEFSRTDLANLIKQKRIDIVESGQVENDKFREQIKRLRQRDLTGADR